MPIKYLFKRLDDHGLYAPRPLDKKAASSADSSPNPSAGSSLVSTGSSSTITCLVGTKKGTKCSRGGTYNGYCSQHWPNDTSGKAEAEWKAKNGTPCAAKTENGTKCYYRGDFNGFCHMHLSKDTSGRAKTAHDKKKNACRGTTGNNALCCNSGTYGGYCHHHVDQDRSGRAKILHDAKKLAAKAPAAAPRPAAMSCLGITQKNALCSNNGKYNGYCHQHVAQDRSGSAAKEYAANKK